MGYFLFGESGALSSADNGCVFLGSAGGFDAFFLKTFYSFLCGEVAVFGSFGVPFERSGRVRCRAVAVFVHYGHKAHRQGVASFCGGEIPCEGACDVFLDAVAEFVHAAEIVSCLNVSGHCGLFVVCGGFVVLVLGVEDSGGAHHGVGVAAVGTATVPFECFPGVARTSSAGFIVEVAEESLCAGHAHFGAFLDERPGLVVFLFSHKLFGTGDFLLHFLAGGFGAGGCCGCFCGRLFGSRLFFGHGVL